MLMYFLVIFFKKLGKMKKKLIYAEAAQYTV